LGDLHNQIERGDLEKKKRHKRVGGKEKRFKSICVRESKVTSTQKQRRKRRFELDPE